MNFRKVNNITGWIVLLIATATYTLTREATASFWDCGEFIACANEIGVPHPPGSPLFTMLGRLFIVLFSGGDAANAANSVNLLSAVASGFTILFLFWTITHFARKMFVNHGEQLSSQQLFTVISAGLVGSLAYTFSDTFWFSAVEGEVYALSSFFTALIVWAMLKWEHAYELAKDAAGKTRADRWIVFIFFMLGLAITVHLLNLLTLPAIVMIYYNKKYPFTVKKAIYAFLAACALTGISLLGLVYIIPKWSAAFDRLFVNSFGLPFFSGFAFFFFLLGFLCWQGLRWAMKKRRSTIQLAIWCFIFVLIGYSTYVTTLIRSNANPGIDMANVDNPMSLASYFGREQYGSAPLLYGPHFGAYPADEDQDGSYVIEKGMKWGKLGNRYVELGRDIEYEFPKKDKMIFPRIWDWQDQQDHLRFYAEWLGKGRYQDPQSGRVIFDPPITYGDNINWFFSYQMGLMYWRYFMWNFSGRQNDIQGFGNRRDGNWQTGISFIDKIMLGDQSKLPETLKHNKANNKLFLLPFLLGILGCVFQFIKNKKDWWVSFLLFFFTGIAIGLYLNMPGNQPRERDYAFVGSFYAFAIWIGLAVVAFVKMVKENKQIVYNTVLYGSLLSFVITAFSLTNFSMAVVFKTSIVVAVLFAVFSFAITYLLRAVSAKGTNEKMLNIATAIICLVTPLIMASQEWDDHDRSNKTLARDNAKNYLESCAPNAILFTFGDNDTYPLWYAQEVEQVRPDIRIINTSLLGIDWYINQLRYKINKSDSIDVIWAPEKIIGDRRVGMQYYPTPEYSKEAYYNLYDIMKKLGDGDNMQVYPVKRFSVPVDSALVRSNGTVNSNDIVPKEIRFELPRNYMQRDHLAILTIIAANAWKRPIYFTSGYNELGFGSYLRKDGLTFRLTPIANNTGINDNWMMNNLLTKFSNGNAAKPGVYFDEENRRHLTIVRQLYTELAGDLLNKNRKDDAAKIIRKADSLVPGINVPYGMASRYEINNETSMRLMDAAYQAGEKEIAEKIKKALFKDFDEQMNFYAALGDMSRKELDNLLQNFFQQRTLATTQQQQAQAEGYLDANLNGHQRGLSLEITRTYDLQRYAKQIEERNNPKPVADSLLKKADSILQKADSPKGK